MARVVRLLCLALVPPPRFHRTRFFGVLATGSTFRRHVVPAPPDPTTHPVPVAPARPRRMGWAELRRRVFLQDILACPCGGRLRLRAAVPHPDLAGAILSALILNAQRPISFYLLVDATAA